MNDEPSHVLCTVFMVRVSEDGSAQVVGPAVPEWTQHYYKKASFDIICSVCGDIC